MNCLNPNESNVKAGEIRIARHHEVCRKLNLSPSTLFAMIASGRFPKPFPIVPGGRAVGWLEHDVDAWIEQRRAGCEVVS